VISDQAMTPCLFVPTPMFFNLEESLQLVRSLEITIGSFGWKQACLKYCFLYHDLLLGPLSEHLVW
jgi:hypothetical protein